MTFNFDPGTFLGPLGLVAFLLLCFAALAPWVKGMIEARIKGLEDALRSCQTQHDATNAQLLVLSSENGYLRGRIEALEGRANEHKS